MRRQGATGRGLKKRVRNLGFERVADPREPGKVVYPLPALLTALVAAMVTLARSLRMVEQRTAQMARKLGSWMDVASRIADNTFGKVLPRLDVNDLLACLHRLVKAEHRRGNLKPTRLPWGAVAIDGKNVVTVHWLDMLRDRASCLAVCQAVSAGASVCSRGWRALRFGPGAHGDTHFV
jgi:hypothetical protein